MSLFIIADIIGIIAFAISGFLVGVRHRLDLLGMLIAAALTALGGGIIRDTVMGRTPFAFDEYYPAITGLLTISAAFAFKLYKRDSLERQWLFVCSDTIGLVAFSITGALLAIEADYNFFGVIMLSFITAVGGGMIRDVMINQVPAVLITDFYGSIALIVSSALLILNSLAWMNEVTILLVALFSITLRLIAHLKDWHLPKLSV